MFHSLPHGLKKRPILFPPISDVEHREPTLVMRRGDQPVFITDDHDPRFIRHLIRFFSLMFNNVLLARDKVFDRALGLFVPAPECFIQCKEKTVFEMPIKVPRQIAAVRGEEVMTAE